MTPADLPALLERVRAATGPDLQIDMAVVRAFDMPNPKLGEGHRMNFTGSIDAVVALAAKVLPGSTWLAGTEYVDDEYGAEGQIFPHPGNAKRRPGHTPALALLAAVIAAKISQEATDD